MSKWKAKAIIQKGISIFPQREKINYLFQKYVTKGVYLTDEYFGYKIQHAKDHIQYFKKYSERSFETSNVLELGTGWYPIVPIAMYLNDFKEIVSIDIQSWMNFESQITTIEMFKDWRERGKLDAFLPELNESKWNLLMNILKDKSQLNIEKLNKIIHLKPSIQDARKTDFKSDSFDFICSNNTFEHIPKNILIPILKEFQRIIKVNGVQSHFIDMSDHFAHFDHSINIYNFLRYSSKKWDWIDNRIQPQNRMRLKDYHKIYQDLNLPITDESFREGDIQLLSTVPIHDEFKNYTKEELAISHAYLISKC